MVIMVRSAEVQERIAYTLRKTSNTAVPAPTLRKLKASVLGVEVAEDTNCGVAVRSGALRNALGTYEEERKVEVRE